MTDQEMLEKARNGICPLCGRGAFKNLALHANRAHGLPSREFKDLLGVTYAESFLDPETQKKWSEKAKTEFDRGSSGIKVNFGPRRVSVAAKRIHREKLDRWRETADPEAIEAQRRLASVRAGEAAKAKAAERPPRFCDVESCGEVMAARGLCNAHYLQDRRKELERLRQENAELRRLLTIQHPDLSPFSVSSSRG